MKTEESSLETVQEESIKIIFVFPRDHERWRYIVNNGRTHAAKSDNLRKFLIDLSPERSPDIIDLMRHFQMFSLDVENNEVQRFYVDQDVIRETNRKQFMEESRNYQKVQQDEQDEEANSRPFESVMNKRLGKFLQIFDKPEE